MDKIKHMSERAQGRRLPNLKHPLHYLSAVLAVLVMSVSVLAAQNTGNINVTIDPKGKTLSEVIPEITRQTGMEFSYNMDLLKTKVYGDKPVNGSLETVLESLLKDTGIKFRIDRSNIYLMKEPQTQAARPTPQPTIVRITGTVIGENGEPLPGVTVVESNSNATITDIKGQYAISVKPSSEITFSYIGYETVVEKVGGRTTIDLVMKEAVTAMDEVVVVGYRSIRKASLTGSVATIDISRKEVEPITNSTQLLYGTPGIWVSQSGAQPGRDNATIRIRGVNSLNSTGGDPLVLLDGVEFDFSDIDPSTIESISVLKDVSAAIYGMKAANGVILVTSKKAAKGRPRVEYKFKFGIQQATTLPDVVTDPIRYMQLRNQAEINSGISPNAVTYAEADIQEYEKGMAIDRSVYPASDWFDICLNNGYVQQHNLRVTGGTETISYTIGLGFTDQKGLFIDNDNSKRYALDMRLVARVNKRLNVSASFNGSLRHFNEVGFGTSGTLQALARGLPIFSDYHNNGLYGSTWLYTPGRNKIENPRMHVEQGFIYRDFQELLATVNADYQVTSNLKYYVTGGLRKIDHYSKQFKPQLYIVQPKTGDVEEFNTSAPSLQMSDNVQTQYSLSHRFVYEKIFAGKHDLHLMAGQDIQDRKGVAFQAYNHGFNDNTLTEFNALTNQDNARATGSSSFDRIMAFYGRAAYTYDERYVFETTLRYDGSSRLSKEHRWKLFPSVLAAWNINNERFFNAEDIQMVKFRASAGVMGSQSVSRYSYMMTYNALSNNYSFGGNVASAFAVTTLTDNTLGWEKTASYNIGADLVALKSRLAVEADVFYKRTSDILMTRTVPSHVGGLSGPNSNVGTVDNKGLEIAIGWRDKIKDFSYGINGSFSFVRNKVVDLNGDEIISGNLITREGYPIKSFYLYQADGYYQSQEEIDATDVVYGNRSALYPGYLKYANINGDDRIDEEDKIVVGNTIPEITYTFGLHLGYKNWKLEAQFQGVGEVYVYPTGNLAMPFNNGAGVTKDWATNSWSPENRNSKYPILTTYTNATANFVPSTHWLQNASYLRMKNIQLSYTFPRKMLSKVGIHSAQIYISGQNLLTFTNFKLWDPELTTTSTTLYEYPNLKTYAVGLNVTF